METRPLSIQQAAAQERLRRSHALESLSAFREYIAPTGHSHFLYPPSRHHKVMMAQLERLGRREIKRLLILAPPGSAKSTYCSIQFVMQWWARNAGLNVLCASNTQALAEDFNRRRRTLALNAEWQTLSSTALADDLQGVELFGSKKQGRIRAVGVTGTVVGFRSHLNVLDDPIAGVEEACSSAALEKQWKWFVHEFRQRLVPDGLELIVSTRWAKRDIAGRIIELCKEGKENWEILRLPYEADSEDDPLGRSFGEPLWAEWYTTEKIEREKRDVFLWSTQYQQTPLDETGSWIGEDALRDAIEDSAPESLTTIIGFDLALTVGKGDYTAIIVAGVDSEDVLHVLHVDRRRVDPATTALNLFHYSEYYEPAQVVADDDNSTKVFKAGLLDTAKRTGKSMPLFLLPMRGRDKETRAAPLRMLFMQRRVKFLRRDWTGPLIRELLDWDTDDQIDALGLIARRLPYLSRPDATPQNDQFTGKQIRVLDGRLVMNETMDELFEARQRKMAKLGGRI